MSDYDRSTRSLALAWLCSVLVALVLGAVSSALMRYQVGWPGRPVPLLGKWIPEFVQAGGSMPPESYGRTFSFHGTVMFFFVMLPALHGFLGTAALPLFQGRTGVSYVKLGWVAWAAHTLGLVALVASLIAPQGGPGAGWSSYPPLSTREWTPGWGPDLGLIALMLYGLGAVGMAICHLATLYVRRSTPESPPICTGAHAWGVAAGMTVLAVPSLLVGTALLLSDRRLGTTFFGKSPGDPLLWQHLFWFYAHPATYMMILPAMGAVAHGMLHDAGERTDRWINGSITAIGTIGFGAWGHHMFQAGLDPRTGGGFSVATYVIALPAAIIVFRLAALVSRKALATGDPGAWARLGFVLLFTLGGLGGLFLASAPLNAHLHETYFVVGHIHMIMFGGAALGLVAGYHGVVENLVRNSSNRGLGLVHVILTVVGLLVTFGGMHVLGWNGMARRVYDASLQPHLSGLLGLNAAVSRWALWTGCVQGLFVLHVGGMLFSGYRLWRWLVAAACGVIGLAICWPLDAIVRLIEGSPVPLFQWPSVVAVVVGILICMLLYVACHSSWSRQP